jgi:hypothetical protein
MTAKRHGQTPGRRWRISAIIGAAGLVLPLGRARAAEAPQAPLEGPIVIGAKPQKFRFLDLERPELTLSLLMQYSDNTQKSPGSNNATTQTTFQEEVGLKTAGYLISPNFFDMKLAGDFGLSESQANTNTSGIGDNGQSNGTIYDYDVSGTLRRQSSFPITAYARRTQDLTNQTFGQTLRDTTNTYGVDAVYESRILPTTFRVQHMDQQQTGLTSITETPLGGAFSLSQDTFNWHTDWRPSARQSLAWDYRVTQADQTNDEPVALQPNATISYNTEEASLIHTFQFGKSQRTNLTSNLDYFDQTGSFAQERLTLDERLQFQHTNSFETYYDYRYNDSTFGDVTQTEQSIKGGFTHRIFQSLVTTGDVGANFLTFGNDGSTTDEQYADLNIDYTKNVPLGKLSLNGSTSVFRQQNDTRSAPVQVVDQSYTFNNYQPITIIRPFLDPNSIRITSANGLFTYTRNQHYTVQNVPGGVQIQPIPGQFSDPVTPVLINYTLLPEPANNQNTNSFGFGGRYEFTEGVFKGLGSYARYLIVDQTISSDQESSFIPDNIRDFTFGADYRIWKFIFSAERQDHESTVSPFVSTRFSGQFQHAAGSDTMLSLNTQYQMIEYPTTSSTVLTVGGSLNHRFSRNLYGILTASWLSEKDSEIGTTTGTDIELQLNWKVRQTEVYGDIRRSTLNTIDNDTSFLFFEVGIKRTF